MQKCLKCSTQFTWKDIIKSKWYSKGYKPLECQNCNTKHNISFKTKMIYSLLIMAIPVLLVYIRRDYIVNLFGYYYLLIYVIWIALIIFITPFYARYELEVKK